MKRRVSQLRSGYPLVRGPHDRSAGQNDRQTPVRLRPLRCARRAFVSQGATTLARALRSNRALTELDLRWNDIGNSGARALLGSLDSNRSLASLKLSGNKVTGVDHAWAMGSPYPATQPGPPPMKRSDQITSRTAASGTFPVAN